MKQAIITGATGFIGSYFVEFLSKKGIDVIALGRKKYKDISIIRRKRIKDSKYIRIDMSNINLLKKELKKNKLNIDNNCVFINLAWAGKNKLSDLEVK